MNRRAMFDVRLRQSTTSEEHVRTILSNSESKAKESAILKARAALPLFAERIYERFEVLSCEVRSVPGRSRAG